MYGWRWHVNTHIYNYTIKNLFQISRDLTQLIIEVGGSNLEFFQDLNEVDVPTKYDHILMANSFPRQLKPPFSKIKVP